MAKKRLYRHRPSTGQRVAIKRLTTRPRVTQDRDGLWSVHSDAGRETLMLADDAKTAKGKK